VNPYSHDDDDEEQTTSWKARCAYLFLGWKGMDFLFLLLVMRKNMRMAGCRSVKLHSFARLAGHSWDVTQNYCSSRPIYGRTGMSKLFLLDTDNGEGSQ
jgi:hypothetical protein